PVSSEPSNLDGYAQKRCRNCGGLLVWASVLAHEQGFQLLLELSGPAVLFCSLEGIHCRPVISAEILHDRGGRFRGIECKRIPLESNILLRNSRAGESLDNMALNSPRHWAD